MSIIPIDDVTRLTLTERPDGLLRLGVEHADEDLVGNVTWTDPSGSWAYLTPEDVGQLRAALAEAEAGRRIREAVSLLREDAS